MVAEVQRFAPGAFYWETFSEEIKTDLCCAGWHDDDSVALIDPVPLSMKALHDVCGRASNAGVLLTNANHERGAAWYHEKLMLPIYAHVSLKAELDKKVTSYFEDGETLLNCLRAIHLPGSSPTETAFYTEKNGGIVFIGDALVNLPSMGGFTFLPDKYSKDPQQSRESLRKLLNLEFQMMTFAHGQPITRDGRARLAALLEH